MGQGNKRKSYWLTVSLIVGITAIAALFAYRIGEARAEIHSLREKQREKLQLAFALNTQCRKLKIKKHYLLTHPSAIIRMAREDYDYYPDGEEFLAPHTHPRPESYPDINIPKSQFSFLLGSGQYPWRIPALAFAVSLLFLGSIDILSTVSDSKSNQ